MGTQTEHALKPAHRFGKEEKDNPSESTQT